MSIECEEINCVITLLKNLFEKNVAAYSVCLDYQTTHGSVISFNNTLMNNSAELEIGGGSLYSFQKALGKCRFDKYIGNFVKLGGSILYF